VRTEDLIVTLAHESGPWTPLPPVRTRALRWLLLATGLGAIAVASIGARADLRLAIQSAPYVWLAAFTLGTGLVAAVSAMTLSVPGAERTPILRIAAVILALAWLFTLALRLAAGGDGWARLAALPNHWACVAEIVALSIASGWAFLVMLRHAAPLRPRWAAGLATLAAAALGAAAVQLICPIDDPAHQIVSHVTTVLALVVVGTLAGRRALTRP
jgi:hypothetical protein